VVIDISSEKWYYISAVVRKKRSDSGTEKVIEKRITKK
jgi:hypothetical protein